MLARCVIRLCADYHLTITRQFHRKRNQIHVRWWFHDLTVQFHNFNKHMTNKKKNSWYKLGTRYFCIQSRTNFFTNARCYIMQYIQITGISFIVAQKTFTKLISMRVHWWIASVEYSTFPSCSAPPVQSRAPFGVLCFLPFTSVGLWWALKSTVV